MNETFILSILIPAYDYPEGLERVLSSLSPAPSQVEVLVFDDSYAGGLKKIVDRYYSSIPSLSYKHNSAVHGTSLGAGYNWNSLLDAAKGKYIILMHHDEFACESNFYSTLLPVLTGPEAPDVVMLDLLLLDESLRPLAPHVPRRLRWLLTQYAPGYLFRRNVIGPTATLVMRRLIAPRFDTTLRWLIDVEFYIRLRRSSIVWLNARSIHIGSVQRKMGSITIQLAAELSTINKAERYYLLKHYPKDKAWLGGGFQGIILFLERIVWMFLRGALIAQNKFSKLIKR